MGRVINSREIVQIKAPENEQSQLFGLIEQQRVQLDTLAEQLSQLSQEVIFAQENERQRIARELHDETGQALAVLKVSLELLRADLFLQEPAAGYQEPNNKRLEDAICLCERTMTQIRLLAHELHPAALEDLGLNLALEGLCQEFSERTRLPVTYTGSEPPSLSEAAKICLYRCAQEGLTNALKHARARQVTVVLSHARRQVSLSVADDGRGYAPQAGNGMGLRGLAERLAVLGGRLEILTQPEEGTVLTAIIPE